MSKGSPGLGNQGHRGFLGAGFCCEDEEGKKPEEGWRTRHKSTSSFPGVPDPHLPDLGWGMHNFQPLRAGRLAAMPCLPDPQKGRPFITRFPEVSSKLLYEEASGLKGFISHTHSLLGRTEIYSPRAYLPRQGKELTAAVRSPPRPAPSPPSQSQSRLGAGPRRPQDRELHIPAFTLMTLQEE